jgi:uncharacterized protein YjbI with pentapeptide repeats
MNAEQLKEILHLHLLWLKNPEEGCRANLIRADLSGANLSGANLSGANLSRANLRGADLWEANLIEANLREADLSRADLREAKFTVELKDAVNLHTAVYYPQQFAFLALNPSFLEACKVSQEDDRMES